MHRHDTPLQPGCVKLRHAGDNAHRLAEDPTRMLALRERRETRAALTATLHWFEPDARAEERNCQGCACRKTASLQHSATRSPSRRVTLKIDRSESPVHGAQEPSADNGHSANGWAEVLLPVADRYRDRGRPSSSEPTRPW
jgi:hypothetical protein